MHAFAGSIDAVASCITKEYELNTELDAMSQELAGRYEELNLVYDTNDDVVEYNHEADTIKQLLQNCVEYLDVGLVALISPDTGHDSLRGICNGPGQGPVSPGQPFANDLYARMSADQTCLIFNKVPDPQRNCPVAGYTRTRCLPARSQCLRELAIASLVCLNRLTRPDFFNSDKNLLDVMSRKVSKIIQVNHDAMTGLINLRAFTLCPAGCDGVYPQERCVLHLPEHRSRPAECD